MSTADRIVVLGMHRSGTSLVARLLGALGCWLGAEPDPHPAPANDPEGYSEYPPVHAVNEALLAGLGGSWYGVVPLAETLPSEVRSSFDRRCREALRGLESRTPWAVKDPRFSLLLPFWAESIERPVCVLVHRDPIEVALSLRRREGFPLQFGLALWEHYNLEALRVTRGLPRVAVSYRRLIQEPAAEIERLYLALVGFGVPGLVPLDQTAQARLVSSGLYRQRRSEHPELKEPLDERWAALETRLEHYISNPADPPPPAPRESRRILEIGGELATQVKELRQSERDLARWCGGQQRLLDGMLGSRRWRLVAALRRWFRGPGDEEAVAGTIAREFGAWGRGRSDRGSVRRSEDS